MYYIDNKNEKVYFLDLALKIAAHKPELKGKHIIDQLQGLGLYDNFKGAFTPHALPYSFTNYLTIY